MGHENGGWMNSDQREAAGQRLPKRPSLTLEDRCTHILSERLNDRAPIGEEAYRPHARRLIEIISTAERARIRRELLGWYEGDTGEESFPTAINRICGEG